MATHQARPVLQPDVLHWLSAFSAHTLDGVALLDADSTVLYASPAALDIFGYSQDEFVGSSGYAIVHPDDLAATQQAAAGADKGAGGSFSVVNRMRHKDGSWRWIQSRVTNYTADSLIGAMMVTFRDVTASAKVQRELEESSLRLNLALDAARLGSWELNVATGALECSGRCKANFGLPPTASLSYSELVASILPEDRPVMERAVAEALGDATVYDATYRVSWPDGSIHWIQASGRGLYGNDGAPERMVGFTRDVTAEKHAEAALQASEERYRTFIQQSTEGIWRLELEETIPIDVDADTLIDIAYRSAYLAECNDVMARMYGFERPEEIIGARLGDLLPPTEPRNREYLLSFVRAGFRLTDSESVEVDRYGNAVYFLNNLIGIVENGVLQRVWGTQRNITEWRVLEDERANLLAREQAARKAAEEAVALRDTFLSVAAHELKTPLTSLLGYTQLLQRRAARDTSLAPLQLRWVSVIAEQSIRLNKLVTDLLDVSRIKMGRLSLERVPLNIVELVGRVVDDVLPSLERHTLTYTPAEPALIVLGDALRLEQVLQNLIQNAVKYSPQGGPVAIHVERRAGDACVTVTDRGIGVPSEALPHLFERFYRAENAHDNAMTGMGIGLFVVNEIVALHGGSIGVDSVVGEGSAFTVRLPLADVALLPSS